MINNRTYLSIDRLKRYTTISKNVDVELLEPFISSTEKMYIINDILGVEYDTYLKEKIASGATSQDEDTLINDYIIPASAWCTYYKSLLHVGIKVNSKGINIQTDDAAEPATDVQVRMLQNEIKVQMTFYLDELRDFIDTNEDKYKVWQNQNKEPYVKTSNFHYFPKKVRIY